jgi:hypothetical protein
MEIDDAWFFAKEPVARGKQSFASLEGQKCMSELCGDGLELFETDAPLAGLRSYPPFQGCKELGAFLFLKPKHFMFAIKIKSE